MQEMKDSGIVWCDKLPNDWKVLRIKNVMFERREKANSEEDEPLSVTQKYGIVKSKDIEVYNPSISYEDYIAVSKGDIVFNKYKAHSGVFFATPYDGMVTFNYSVYRCFEGYNPKYFEYLFHTTGCIGEFRIRLHGVGESISPLYTKDLFSITVFAPPIDVQNRIVDYLDRIVVEINSILSDIEHEIELLEQYKRSVITEAVTKGLNPDAEMKDSGIEWMGRIPAHWTFARIGGLYGLRIEKVSDNDFEPLSVTKLGVVPQLETAAKTNAHDDRKLVRKGDFVINSRSDRRGSCGISNYDGSVSLINTVLYPLADMNPQYYNWLFHTTEFADEFYRWGHGIVDDLWTTGWQDMKNIVIISPPMNEQKAIADYLDFKCAQIDEIIAQKREQISTIEEYKKSLIFEYVTGKKEVRT